MGNDKTTIEIIAPNVEEAISRGVEELGVTKDDVLIEVLDEGSKGLFGLGGRHARVRLTFNSTATNQPTIGMKNMMMTL